MNKKTSRNILPRTVKLISGLLVFGLSWGGLSGHATSPSPPRLLISHNSSPWTQSSARSHWQVVWQSKGPQSWNIAQKAWPYNNELEYYTPQALHWNKSGDFNIKASPHQDHGRSFISARLRTRGIFAFEYGTVHVTAHLPQGQGVWPAIWLRPLSGHIYPEVDIMEHLGSNPTVVYEVLHTRLPDGTIMSPGRATPGPRFQSGWNTFSLQWEPNWLQWRINGHPVLTLTHHVPHQPMYLVINLAIGGQWPGPPNESTPWPAVFKLRHIQITQYR